MIENYDEITRECGCHSSMLVEPDGDMRRWACQQVVSVLANADYYYTKDEVNFLIQQVTVSGVTRQEVEQMIAIAVSDKASKEAVEALSGQVASNTAQLLNTYTKDDVNSKFANYSKVQGETLFLNSENITI